MVSRKLDLSDIISLCFFGVLVAIKFALNFYHISYHNPRKDQVIYDIATGFLALFVITTTPFSIRFRNWFFIAPWLFLCLLFILAEMRPIACPALAITVWFYILRYFFIAQYDREFIPTNLDRTFQYPYFSKLDNRESEKADFNFMRIYLSVGLLSFFVCIFLSGVPVKHEPPKAQQVRKVDEKQPTI